MFLNLGSPALFYKRRGHFFLGSPAIRWLWLLVLCPASGCSAASNSYTEPPPPVTPPGAPWFSPPPSDARVLFDGNTLDQWQRRSGRAVSWTVRDGHLEVRAWKGSIWTKRAWGDVQLHLEWSAPLPVSGRGQRRGNSGVKFMGLYEVQILDSFENETYPDGQAAAVYGQHPPLVNASLPPGVWQSYDILFRRPRFGKDGNLAEPAMITMFHNGVLVQDHVKVTGPTKGRNRPYAAHPDRLPLMLQNHGSRVRFRNIWVRELEAPLN